MPDSTADYEADNGPNTITNMDQRQPNIYDLNEEGELVDEDEDMIIEQHLDKGQQRQNREQSTILNDSGEWSGLQSKFEQYE